MLEESVFLQESLEKVLDLLELSEVFLGVNRLKGKPLSLVFKKTQNRRISDSLSLNTVEVMERLGLIRELSLIHI